MSNIMEEIFSVYEGKDRSFTLNGKEIVIPARLDTFNFYKVQFEKVARYCSDNATAEYKETVNDFDTFMNLFPEIYGKHLDAVIEKAMDILISDGIYIVSEDNFCEAHIKNFRLAWDDYSTMKRSAEMTIENNSKITGGILDAVGSILGSRSSIAKGFVEGVTSGAKEEASQINDDQKIELYGRIKLPDLFNRVYTDYRNVAITLVGFLLQNGRDIWCADSEGTDNIDIIFRNMARPTFPQEKILDGVIDIIQKDPYKPEVFEFVEEKFGKTPEVEALFNYFNYPEYNKPIYSESDFPEPEKAVQSDSETTAQENTSNNTAGTKKRGKGFLSFVENLDSEQVKKGLKLGAGALAAGVILGGQNGGSAESKKKDSGKKDYMGTAGCKKTNYSLPRGEQTCVFCPLKNKCSSY